MKTKWFITLALLSAMAALATPIKLTVRPKGTNQVELTFGPVATNAWYQVLVRTNGPDGHWITFSDFLSGNNKAMSVTTDLGGIQGLTMETLKNWTFAAGDWNDSEGDEIPLLAKELIFRTDPFSSIDPNGSLMGDGWSNIQKLQSNWDPFVWHPPPGPQLSVSFHPDNPSARKGSVILTWQLYFYSPVPDYFLIERANRTMRPMTNRPPNFSPMYGRPGWQRENPLVTGLFELAAQVPGKPGVRNYRYVETNVDTLFQPLYRIQAHYSPPLHAHLAQVNAATIRETMLPVMAQPTTNGYALTVTHPIPYALYLLLVRDKSNPQWRASGYFTSGTNRNPVYLHVDKKGMMSDGQSPIAMPEVKFLPEVVEPEFTAGWGEDSDGDGLPDIYEVLVTHTDPDNADTGNTGILDGYKEMTGDGWNNLEKFRRRVNPLHPAQPPATIELIKPTGNEIMQAITPKTDLSCELQIEVRTNGDASYQPIEQVPLIFSKIMNFRQANEHKNFDLRISWQFAESKANQDGSNPFDRGQASFQALASLMERAGIQLAEAFKANLATNPPLSRSDTSNQMAAIMHSYRQGEMDKGAAMEEMMVLQDNQSQDFYGKVIDQYGQPVVGAEVAVEINLAVGRSSTQKTQTDANGLFQFTGLRGQSLSITPERRGFQIEGHGLGLKGLNGPETNPNNRAIYTMWKLKGPEPMIHKEVSSRKIQPDGRRFTVDFLKNTITEGTNAAGDLLIQIQRPPQVKPRGKYDWSFVMTAIDGGFIEVTNDDYLNEAPESDYQPQYQMNRYATNVMNYSTRQLYRTDRTFFLKSRGGQVYGHFHIMDLEPDYRGMAALQIEYYINPSGSRNLEFDPARQIQ